MDNLPTFRQVLFILLIVFVVLLLLSLSVVYIHNSWPNLTQLTAMPDCVKEIVGNCDIR